MTRCIKTSKTNSWWSYLDVSVSEDPCNWNLVALLLRTGTMRSRPNQTGPDQCVRALITDFIPDNQQLSHGQAWQVPPCFVWSRLFMLYSLIGRIFEQETWSVSTLKLFRRVRIVPKGAYYLRHICLSACISAAVTGRIFAKFDIEDFFVNVSRKSKFGSVEQRPECVVFLPATLDGHKSNLFDWNGISLLG
jgi:hypothetical protein